MKTHPSFGWRKDAAVVTLTVLLVGCDVLTDDDDKGGGKNNNLPLDGGTVSGSLSSNDPPPLYSFPVQAGKPYTVTVRSTSGAVGLMVADMAPPTSATADIWAFDDFGLSMNYFWGATLDTVSFIPASDTTAYPWLLPMTETASYTIEATSGELAVDGLAKSGAVFEDSIYFSFDANAGEYYQVDLTVTAGEADLEVYSGADDFFDNVLTPWYTVASSSEPGSDSVIFRASATGIHYIEVSSPWSWFDESSEEAHFNIQVSRADIAPDLTISLDSALKDDTNLILGYTVTNQGLADANPFAVDFWGDAASAPSAGDSGTHIIVVNGLAVGASTSGTMTLAVTAESGTAYAIVDTLNNIAETNEANNVSAGRPWVTAIVYPFEDGSVPAVMTMSGDAEWQVDDSTASSGTYSLRSGIITHSQASCVTLTAATVGSISFDWKVDSESYYDYLFFYVDGVWVARISGSREWAPYAHTVSEGIHEYAWCYEKDSVVSVGADAGWIDNILIR